MTKLVLDPMCVLSAWEQMGGSAFSSDDAVNVEDPEAFALDLSSWEAQFKPMSAPAASPLETNIFATLFPPLEMACFPFLPSCQVTQPAGSSGIFGEGPQVVPMCPSVSAGSVDNTSNMHNNNNISNTHFQAVDGGLGATQADCIQMLDDAMNGGCPLDEDMHMSLHFSDMDSLPSSSPCTSEAGIVPDFDGGTPIKAHPSPQSHPQLYQQSSMCTASSGGGGGGGGGGASDVSAGGAPAPAPASSMPQLPVLLSLGAAASSPQLAPQLPSSFFVPVGPQHPGAAGLSALTGCGVPVCPVKQEPTALLTSNEAQQQVQQQQQHQHQQQQQKQQSASPEQQPQPVPYPSSPAAPPAPQPAAPSAAAPAVAARQGAAQQSQGRTQGVAAPSAAGAQSQQQPQQQPGTGAVAHIRTRAECLERYRQKKARRLYTKKIRYQLRKINADKRPRIKGRFVKKEELAEFLAAQRGAGGGGGREEAEVEDPYFGMDSDEE